MSDFYQPGHRALQREFESTALADRLETLIVRSELDAEAQAFIEQQDHFFLSTLGADGFPTVSYKGGDTGFVKIDDPKTLRFPCFDGNGMWLSMGNIVDRATSTPWKSGVSRRTCQAQKGRRPPRNGRRWRWWRMCCRPSLMK